ncbi:MAG: hypothetical protein ACI89X_002670 [Planctomycetota bacterium]|jgi:hypothetical protein
MRTCTLLATLCVAIFVGDNLEAQRRGGGRNQRRPEEITNRTAAYFTETNAPATQGKKIAPFNSIDLVRAAAAAGQVTVLYLHNSEAERRVVQQFESAVFRTDKSGDVLGLKLRMFHCGQIDISKSPAMKARYEKDVPVFIAFDKTGKELKIVSMSGYKAKASALEALIDQASAGAYKPSIKTIAKKHAKIVGNLEEALKAKTAAEQDQTKAGNDKSKAKKAEKAMAAAVKLEEKALKAEEKLLEDLRLPARGDKKLGGRNNRRNNQAGNTGAGNTGKGNTGKGNTGKGNTGGN